MTPTDSAEKVVAEWRDAMEGVTPGPYFVNPKDQQEVRLDYGKQEAFAYLRRSSDVDWIARCSPSGISGLLAIIESQRATIERVERERDEARHAAKNWEGLWEIRRDGELAAEARVTALEAEKAGLVDAAAEVLKHRVGDLASRTGYLRDNDRSREALEALDYHVSRQALSLSSTEMKNDEQG